jgi:hypothetical protein
MRVGDTAWNIQWADGSRPDGRPTKCWPVYTWRSEGRENRHLYGPQVQPVKEQITKFQTTFGKPDQKGPTKLINEQNGYL